MTWRAFVFLDHYRMATTLRVSRSMPNGMIGEVGPMVMQEREPYGHSTTEPFLQGETSDVHAFLQAMMDAAYEAGLRPSRAQDERHLKAHLEDMRTVAFGVLGFDKAKDQRHEG